MIVVGHQVALFHLKNQKAQQLMHATVNKQKLQTTNASFVYRKHEEGVKVIF